MFEQFQHGLERGRDLFYECKNDIGIRRTYHKAPEGFRSAAELFVAGRQPRPAMPGLRLARAEEFRDEGRRGTGIERPLGARSNGVETPLGIDAREIGVRNRKARRAASGL